jgi:hypothetical protein
MTLFGLSNKYLIVAVLVGIVISIVLSMIFGFILTYTPSKEVIPKIEPTIIPTVTPVINNTQNGNFTYLASSLPYAPYNWIIFIAMFFCISLISSSRFSLVIVMLLSLLGWYFSPSTPFTILLGILFIYYMYKLFIDIRMD